MFLMGKLSIMVSMLIFLVDKIVNELADANKVESQVPVKVVNVNGEDLVENNGQLFSSDGESAPKSTPTGPSIPNQHVVSDICMEDEACIPSGDLQVVVPNCVTSVDIDDNGVQPLFFDDVTVLTQAPIVSVEPKRHIVSEVSIEAAHPIPFADPTVVAPIDSVGSGVK
jgi:hypothetical protein